MGEIGDVVPDPEPLGNLRPAAADRRRRLDWRGCRRWPADGRSSTRCCTAARSRWAAAAASWADAASTGRPASRSPGRETPSPPRRPRGSPAPARGPSGSLPPWPGPGTWRTRSAGPCRSARRRRRWRRAGPASPPGFSPCRSGSRPRWCSRAARSRPAACRRPAKSTRGALAKYFSGGTSRAKVWTKNPSAKRTLPPCLASRRAELEFTRLRAHQSPSKQSADVRLAVLQDRHFLFVDRPQHQARPLGDPADPRGEPAAAEMILQQDRRRRRGFRAGSRRRSPGGCRRCGSRSPRRPGSENRWPALQALEPGIVAQHDFVGLPAESCRKRCPAWRR